MDVDSVSTTVQQQNSVQFQALEAATALLTPSPSPPLQQVDVVVPASADANANANESSTNNNNGRTNNNTTENKDAYSAARASVNNARTPPAAIPPVSAADIIPLANATAADIQDHNAINLSIVQPGPNGNDTSREFSLNRVDIRGLTGVTFNRMDVTNSAGSNIVTIGSVNYTTSFLSAPSFPPLFALIPIPRRQEQPVLRTTGNFNTFRALVAREMRAKANATDEGGNNGNGNGNGNVAKTSNPPEVRRSPYIGANGNVFQIGMPDGSDDGDTESRNFIRSRYVIVSHPRGSHGANKTPNSYRHLVDLSSSNLRCIDIFNGENFLCKIINEPLHKVQRAYYQLKHDTEHLRSSIYGHVLVRGAYEVVPMNKDRTYVIVPLVPQPHEYEMEAPPEKDANVIYEDLHTYIRHKRHLHENEARALFHQICQTVLLCHRNGIIMRDLKLKRFYFIDNARTRLQYESLEGCMILNNAADDTLFDKIGCPLYTAPELLCPNPTYHGKPADMWSLGVILYTMLVGQYPFYEKGNCNLITIIRHCHVQIPTTLSRSVRWLLNGLLRKNYEERIQAEHIFFAPWLKEQRPYYMYIPVNYVPSDDELDDDEDDDDYGVIAMLNARLVHKKRMRDMKCRAIAGIPRLARKMRANYSDNEPLDYTRAILNQTDYNNRRRGGGGGGEARNSTNRRADSVGGRGGGPLDNDEDVDMER